MEKIGFGFFIPVSFITRGMRFDLQALAASPTGFVLPVLASVARSFAATAARDGDG